MVQATNSRSLPQCDHRLSEAISHAIGSGYDDWLRKTPTDDLENWSPCGVAREFQTPKVLAALKASAQIQDEERLRDTAHPLGKPSLDTNISSPLEGEVA